MVPRDLTGRSIAGSVSTLVPIDQPRFLLLCTANQCRSPMAEGLLRHRLAAVGVEAVVRSAGILPGGVPATRHAVEVLAGKGIDLASHQSRTMEAEEIDAADLVLGMERRHVMEAVVLVPAALSWSFTLRDLAARVVQSAPRSDGESVRDWAARLAAGRPRSALVGIGRDDIDDPMGGPKADYAKTAALLDELLGTVVAHAFPKEVAAA